MNAFRVFAITGELLAEHKGKFGITSVFGLPREVGEVLALAFFKMIGRKPRPSDEARHQVNIYVGPQHIVKNKTVELEPHLFVNTQYAELSCSRKRADGAWELDPTSTREVRIEWVSDYRAEHKAKE